eukprot:3032564-Amphidinium_carterae.2
MSHVETVWRSSCLQCLEIVLLEECCWQLHLQLGHPGHCQVAILQDNPHTSVLPILYSSLRQPDLRVPDPNANFTRLISKGCVQNFNEKVGHWTP